MRNLPYHEYDLPAEDEQFTQEDILATISTYMQLHRDEVTATVSAEWERKDQKVRGPLDDPHSYRRYPDKDDLVLTLEIRVGGYQREGIEAIRVLETSVREVTAEREAARRERRISELEEAKAVKLAEAAALDDELAALEAVGKS